TILFNSPPKIVILANDLYEDFIDEEGVTVASVLSLQSFGVKGSEFDAPKTDCYSRYGDAALSQ
ncbi:MAG: hypothetical protein WBM41_04435, partial [Arenicellales bacterium]